MFFLTKLVSVLWPRILLPAACARYSRGVNAAMLPEPFSIHLGIDMSEMSHLEEAARSRGMSVFRLDFSGLEDRDALVDYLARVFMFPHRIVGLDAALDLVSDLGWFGNERGYLVSVEGCDRASVVVDLFASILPNIVDRWRAQDVPFVVVIDGKGHHLQTALLTANRKMDDAGSLPWARAGTARVGIVVHHP